MNFSLFFNSFKISFSKNLKFVFKNPRLRLPQKKLLGIESLLYRLRLSPIGTKFSIIFPGPPTLLGTK